MHQTLTINYIQHMKKNQIFSMKTGQLVHIKVHYKIGKFNIYQSLYLIFLIL